MKSVLKLFAVLIGFLPMRAIAGPLPNAPGAPVYVTNLMTSTITATIQNVPLPVTVTGGTTTITTVYSSFDLSIPVSGGTGSAIFSSTGTLLQCQINPIVSTATYNFDITTNDSDSYPVFGSVRQIVGKVALLGEHILVGSYQATVSNASSDGTYRARCYEKQ